VECLLAALFILVLLSVPLSAAGFSFWPVKGEEALKQVARRFSGAYFRGNWFRPPRVTFRYGTATGLLRIVKRGGQTWLEVVIYGTRPGIIVELRPESIPTPGIRKLEALYSVALNPSQQYYAYGLYAQQAQQFFSDPVVGQLKVLEQWHARSPLVVSVEPADITVRKVWTGGLRQADPLIEFVQLALRLHDHMQLGKEAGIQFVAAQAAAIEHQKCAICGEAIGSEYVSCRQCSAPHHLECWKYNGSCGMFACKELRFEYVHAAPSGHSHGDARWS
jgi:hypothetical protein